MFNLVFLHIRKAKCAFARNHSPRNVAEIFRENHSPSYLEELHGERLDILLEPFDDDIDDLAQEFACRVEQLVPVEGLIPREGVPEERHLAADPRLNLPFKKSDQLDADLPRTRKDGCTFKQAWKAGQLRICLTVLAPRSCFAVGTAP